MSTLDTADALVPVDAETRKSAAPLFVAAALLTMAFAKRRLLQAWLHGFVAASRAGKAGRIRTRPLQRLRDSIIGQSKARVVAALGRPRTVMVDEIAALSRTNANTRGFWRTNWWYYPIANSTPTLLAIRFVAGVARQVDFVPALQKPQRSRSR